MVTRAWKVWGMFDGETRHRQRESFFESYTINFPEGDYAKTMVVENSDITGTNDYSIVRITADTAADCLRMLEAQLSDGVFENSRTGEIEEIDEY